KGGPNKVASIATFIDDVYCFRYIASIFHRAIGEEAHAFRNHSRNVRPKCANAWSNRKAVARSQGRRSYKSPSHPRSLPNQTQNYSYPMQPGADFTARHLSHGVPS